MVLHFTLIEINLVPYNPKEPLIFPFIREYQTFAELISDDEIISETNKFTSSESFDDKDEIFDDDLEQSSKTRNQAIYSSLNTDIRQFRDTCQSLHLNQRNSKTSFTI